MCEPATIMMGLTLAVGAAGAVTTYRAQQQQASAQQQVETQRYAETERFRRENATAAQLAYVENAAQLRIRQSQEAVVKSEETQRIQREAKMKRGQILASASTAGMGLDMLLLDVGRQVGRANTGLNTQALFDQQQTTAEIKSERAQAFDAINSVRPYIRQPVQQPGRLGLAVDLAGAGLSGANTYYSMKKAA